MILLIPNGHPNVIYALAESEFIADYFKDVARLEFK